MRASLQSLRRLDSWGNRSGVLRFASRQKRAHDIRDVVSGSQLAASCGSARFGRFSHQEAPDRFSEVAATPEPLPA